MIEELYKLFAVTVCFILASLLYPAIGALSGLIVGYVFGDNILCVLKRFGADDISMWQVGALIGYVIGLFSILTEKKRLGEIDDRTRKTGNDL